MKKLFFVLISSLLLLTSCEASQENMTIEARIVLVYRDHLFVDIEGDVPFDYADLYYEEGYELSFEPHAEQIIQAEILPQVHKDPPEVTAVHVEKLEDGPLASRIPIKEIPHDEAKKMLENEDVRLLDVRTEEEYHSGHLPDAVQVEEKDLASYAQSELPDKEQTIFVYCRTGIRSYEACLTLTELGYEEIYDLGGIVEWPYEIIEE